MVPTCSTAEPQTLAWHSKARTLFTGLGRHWDLLAVLLLIAASMPPALLSPRTPISVDLPNIDDSWFVDVCYKAVHGVWLGGTAVSTYGPVIQWLASVPVRWTGYSMGKVYATWTIVIMWSAFLLAAFTLQMLLPEQPAWKRFVLLVFLFVFWASPGWFFPDMRPFAGLFLFSLFLRGWYAVEARQIGPVVFGVGAAALCAAAFFVAADTGVYSIAGWLISLAGVALEYRRSRTFVRKVVIVLTAFAASAVLLALGINAIRRTPFDFVFWKDSLVMVSSYRWYAPTSMSKLDKMHLLLALAAAIVVFLLRYIFTRGNKASITGRTGFLAAAFVYGLLCLQTGLVRSDTFHVQMGMFVFTLFIGAILFGLQSNTRASTIAVLAALIFSWLFIDPNPIYFARSIRDKYFTSYHPKLACAPGSAEFDHVCLTPSWFQAFQNTKSYIQQYTSPRESILVFPWNNIFGSVTGRNVAGSVMLSYVASDPYLSDVNLRGLATAAPPAGLYFSEGWGWPVDEVPNFTRNAALWFWIQRHYRGDQQLVPGILGLQADDSRTDKIRTLAETLQIPLQTYPVIRRSSVLDLGSAAWPQDGDVLRIRFNMHYPFWWRLRKPVRSQLEITRADGSRKVVAFVLPPNKSTDVWFYPWDDDVLRFFASDEAQWHAGNHPAITHLRLWLNPIDWISVIPTAVSIEEADAVRLTMQP